jgi:hypothetical protein
MGGMGRMGGMGGMGGMRVSGAAGQVSPQYFVWRIRVAAFTLAL